LRSRLIQKGANMPSQDRMQVPEPLYTMDDLIDARRGILRYARTFPPGRERNQHRQIAVSLRRLARNQNWLNAHTVQAAVAAE
jgi:hypothetical protein